MTRSIQPGQRLRKSPSEWWEGGGGGVPGAQPTAVCSHPNAGTMMSTLGSSQGNGWEAPTEEENSIQNSKLGSRGAGLEVIHLTELALEYNQSWAQPGTTLQNTCTLQRELEPQFYIRTRRYFNSITNQTSRSLLNDQTGLHVSSSAMKASLSEEVITLPPDTSRDGRCESWRRNVTAGQSARENDSRTWLHCSNRAGDQVFSSL